jgi:hypothetical protein
MNYFIDAIRGLGWSVESFRSLGWLQEGGSWSMGITNAIAIIESTPRVYTGSYW